MKIFENWWKRLGLTSGTSELALGMTLVHPATVLMMFNTNAMGTQCS
jgi:hypothetical protein